MIEYKDKALIPIRKGQKNGYESFSDDLRTAYSKMALNLRGSPNKITHYQKILKDILTPYENSKGELLILNNGAKICFSYEGKNFTDFGVVLLEVVIVHLIDSVEYHMELLILGQNMQPRIIRLESTKLGSCRWIEDLGPEYIYEKWGIERLETLIKAMAKYAPQRHEYQYSGWNLEEKNIYILNGRRLCGDNWDAEKAKVGCEYAIYMLDVASHLLTVPMLSIELLSLVHSKMVDGDTYFKGVCCIVAPTQSFKTTLAALFFNLKNGMEADINFEATTAAMVRTLGNVRDATVIVDDYKPGTTKSESNDMRLKLSKIIRMCSDDSGGIKKAGLQKPTIADTAHCMAVVTAEQIQLNVQSTLARLLVLETNRKSMNREKLTYFQTTHSKYREFIESFIMYISTQGIDAYCENLAQRFLRERETLRKKIAAKDMLIDNRTNDMCVWLYISFLTFLDYSLYVKAINQEQFEKFKQEVLQIFLSIMEQQAERVSELDDVKMFFKGLQVLLETKEEKIEKLQARNNAYITLDSKQAIGFSKKGFIFLKNGIAFQQVVAYYRRFGKNFVSNENAFRKKLWDSGNILSQNEKTCIHRLFVNHETYQCIKFKENKFYELLRGDKKDGSEEDREIPDNRGMRATANVYLGG